MKKIALMSCVVISLILLSIGASFAGTLTNWEMVYDHDSSGVPSNGANINNLKTAVLNGSDIKIVFHGAGGLTHQSIQLERVRLETLSDGTVQSVIGFNNETTPTPAGITGGVYNNATGAVPILQSFSTTGQYIQYYPANSGNPDNKITTTVAITWYVSK